MTHALTGTEASPAPAGLASAVEARAHLTQALHDALCATTPAAGCTGPCQRAARAAENWIVEHLDHAVAMTNPWVGVSYRVVGPWGVDGASDETDARAQVARARAELPSRADEVYWVATPEATWDNGSQYTAVDQDRYDT